MDNTVIALAHAAVDALIDLCEHVLCDLQERPSERVTTADIAKLRVKLEMLEARIAQLEHGRSDPTGLPY